MTKSQGNKKPNHPKAAPGTPKKKRQTIKQPQGSSLAHLAPLFFLGISALIVLYTRLKLLAIPMERDEAGFAYIGHWLFKDKSLYVDMIDNKLPGLYILYGLFTNMFGYTSTGVHVGLLLANITSGILFYLLIR